MIDGKQNKTKLITLRTTCRDAISLDSGQLNNKKL